MVGTRMMTDNDGIPTTYVVGLYIIEYFQPCVWLALFQPRAWLGNDNAPEINHVRG